MANIFQITSEFRDIENALIESGGELTPELENALKLNSEQLQQKGQGYGYLIKGMEYDVDVINAEIKRLQEMKRVRVNSIERLKTTLKIAMELTGLHEIKTPTLKVSFRKSESVQVDDVVLLDEKYVRTKVIKEADKTAIKEAIKAGEAVTGATLNINYNLQIK